jgi:hypothetical protein
VRSDGHRSQNGQTLGRDLQTVPPEQRIVVNVCVPGHTRILTQCWCMSRSGWMPVPDQIVIRSMSEHRRSLASSVAADGMAGGTAGRDS